MLKEVPRLEKKSAATLPFYQQQDNEIALFEHAYQNHLPLLIKGPTGCGKTRFIEHMAERLGRPLITVSCHDDLTATDLVGRHLIGDGETVWCDGPLTQAVRQGAICYLDEVVEARKDTTVILHSLTDHRRSLSIERTGEVLHAPDDFMLVISYNPGYQNLLKGMKPSTRQRFLAVSFDYPEPDVEQTVICRETGIAETVAEQLIVLAQSLRALSGYDLEEGVSTRLLVYAAMLIKSGMNPIEACRAAVVEPLSDEDETISALMEVVDACMG